MLTPISTPVSLTFQLFVAIPDSIINPLNRIRSVRKLIAIYDSGLTNPEYLKMTFQ